MKIMERRIRGKVLRSPAAQFLRESSSSSNRPLHTTSSLHARAATSLQDSEDDEDLNAFVASHMQELVVRKTSNAALENESSKEQKHAAPQHQPRFEDLVFDSETPPKTLDEWQDWFEFDAQRESVERYQQLSAAARKREDYASMGVVQRQVLDWYQPLKDVIHQEQATFVSGKKTKKTMKLYGHHLCALAPEKLAIMVAHEAISYSLTHAKASHNGYGVMLVSMALHLGLVVETEIHVHRAIEKQTRANQTSASKEGNPFLEALADVSLERGDMSSCDAVDDDDKVDEPGWMYTAHHRDLFLTEISKNKSNRAGRERLRYTNNRARARLENCPEWTPAQHVQLGAALLDMLIRVATVPGLHGDEEQAFSYHKAWQNARLVGWVVMQESFLKQVMEDSCTGALNLWTRYNPMVVPPKPWLSPSEGAYKWVKVEAMRTHGSKIQRVSCT